jgi:hypothetical protein
MKILIPTLIVAIVVAVILLIKVTSYRRSTSPGTRDPQMTLEQKLEILASCGCRLAEPFTRDDLLKSWSRADYEKPGYDLTLVGLGMTEEQEPWRNHCVNLWHLDTECIEDHGDYKKIAERMAEMAEGSLPVENVQDYVDVDNKEAWLSFSFRGKDIKIPCEVQDDWVDPTLFSRFVEVLAQSDSAKTYVYYDLGGQDCLIGCVTKEELKSLNRKGIKFIPMT